MNKIVWSCLVVVWLAAGAAWAGSGMHVQVRDAQVRSTPSFLGKIVGALPYGQRVSVVDQRSSWCRVEGGGVSGWLHASALTTQSLALQSGSGQAPSSVSGREMALAGKGFNAQVEHAYRQGRGANFAAVDKMERGTVPAKRLLAFLREGGLAPQGGIQ